MKNNIHSLSDVQTKDIGEGTRIWQFCVVFAKAKIGALKQLLCYQTQ